MGWYRFIEDSDKGINTLYMEKISKIEMIIIIIINVNTKRDC